MFNLATGAFIGSVEVLTTSGRGFTPEETTSRCMEKLMKVSDSAPDVIREQAKAFESVMREVILFYMKQVVKSDRTTLYNELKNNGYPEAAEIIRRL